MVKVVLKLTCHCYLLISVLVIKVILIFLSFVSCFFDKLSHELCLVVSTSTRFIPTELWMFPAKPSPAAILNFGVHGCTSLRDMQQFSVR